MGLFYTGKGDQGESELMKGRKTDKTRLEMAVLGDLDELNSLLGLVRSQIASQEHKKIVRDIQDDLFTVQANIAVLMYPENFKVPEFKPEKVKQLETLIDAFERAVNPEKGFIVTGENQDAAWFDFARTVARRAERSALRLNKETPLKPEVLSYLNRLSSILFALARISAKTAEAKEEHPGYN